MSDQFWKTKKLEEMSSEEWEALCDGCGKCCVLKLEDEDTAEVTYTSLSCKLFDPNTCRCTDYSERHKKVPECLVISPKNLKDIPWLPSSCSYRLRHEGKELPSWHHLNSKDASLVHTEAQSVQNKVTSLKNVDENDYINYIVDWIK